MDSNVKSAVKEISDLFGTEPKGTTVYFNDVNYTPIPQPICEAVKVIMSEYPDLKYRTGLYSVTVLDVDKKKINSGLNRISSNTTIGKLHDDFVTNKITESELNDILVKKHGYDEEKAGMLVDKWRDSVIKNSMTVIKSSAADCFGVDEQRGKEIDELAVKYDNKSDLRSALEGYFHIYDDYAEMSVEEFEQSLDEYFNEEDESEFITDEITD